MNRIIAELQVTNRADEETQLTLALEAAIEAAKAEKACGVLITRHNYAKFTVAISPKVPYGQTHELDLAPSAGYWSQDNPFLPGHSTRRSSAKIT